MNETVMMLIFFAVPAVVVVVIIVLTVIRAGKRREAFLAVAQELGFDFEAKPEEVWQPVKGLPLFERGHSKRVRNALSGTARDVEVCIFDYRYTVGGGKNSATYNQSVIAFRALSLDLPEFALKPENVFHRIGSVFGYQDIDFDDHPEFSKHYLLRGDDERAVRTVFDEEVLGYFETNQGLSVEGAGDHLIVYRRSKRIDPDEVRAFMETGFGVFSAFAREETA